VSTSCRTDLRRAALDGSALNGIDFVEVLDDPSLPDDERPQRTLLVHFVNPVTALPQPGELRVEGGERIRGIAVTTVEATDDPRVVAVNVNRSGDFSTYTLRLVAHAAELGSTKPPDGIDPVLAAGTFSFKAACGSVLDCLDTTRCPVEPRVEPVLDYLARDYASFRRLMLDRIALLLPEWQERHPADVGVALVELLAYVGDMLSYELDAVATEAYLGTARRRVSVRRHARLVDYQMHDGCNARVWVQVNVDADLVRLSNTEPSPLPAGTQLLTKVPDIAMHVDSQSDELRRALRAGALVFETISALDHLYVDHNELRFYTWGSRDCCLATGSTNATLRGAHPHLERGNVLIFEEVADPATGVAADADPVKRCAVLLTASTVSSDSLTGQAITEIEWAYEDALPFAFTLNRTEESDESQDVTVARGNVVLADHGLRLDEPEKLPAISDATRYRRQLVQHAVTQMAPAPQGTSAAAAFRWDLADVLPDLAIASVEDSSEWLPVRDLLGSLPTAQDFVLEVETDGAGTLRFGDGEEHGAQPRGGVKYVARGRRELAPRPHQPTGYRIGNGTIGNVAAESLAHIVGADSAISSIRNPLPASGGVDPEQVEAVRQKAPEAFRTQERAVTPDDYALRAETYTVGARTQVQRAIGTSRWTGSWHTVFVSADPVAGVEVSAGFQDGVRATLEPFRMIGHDVEIEAPVYVPLELALTVCVNPNYFRSGVQQALLEVFSNRTLPDGRLGVFHPDNFTFGETVYLSPSYAAAQAVDGVDSVRVTKFGRWGANDNTALAAQKLVLQRLEVARLDNDPSFPDRGVFELTLIGGK
jgi:hypothetical protein